MCGAHTLLIHDICGRDEKNSVLYKLTQLGNGNETQWNGHEVERDSISRDFYLAFRDERYSRFPEST